MHKMLKLFFWFLSCVLVVAAAVTLVVYVASSRHFHRTYHISVNAVPLPTEPEALERGHHIAQTRGCTDCHGPDLGGAAVVDNPALGHFHGPNLTRGRGGLPSDFGDTDWVRTIRHGVNANGRALFFMPSQEFAHLTDAELGELIAYLKSIPPVDRERVPVVVGPVGRALVLAGKIVIAAEVIDHANLRSETVIAGRTAEYGRYLAVGCVGCHGPNYSGGKIAAGPPDWPPAANLTPHPTSRLANWTEADFVQTLHNGRRPDGTPLNPAMPRSFGLMNDNELGAIWLFLKSLPASPTGAR